MKCKNCGINYDDGDRECPICGTPAGKGKRASVPRYTSYTHDTHTADDCTHRTFTRKFTTADAPNRSGTRPSGGSETKRSRQTGRRIGIAAVALVVLLELLPMGLRFAEEKFGSYQGGGSAVAPEPIPEEDGQPLPAAAVLGAWNAAETADGGALTLAIDENDDYSLTYETDGASYREDGWAWCVYNMPEEGLYDEAYPPDRYDSFTLCLDFESGSGQGALPAGIDEHRGQGEMWLLAYVPQDGGETVLDDAYGECAAFFGGERFLPLRTMEQG